MRQAPNINHDKRQKSNEILYKQGRAFGKYCDSETIGRRDKWMKTRRVIRVKYQNTLQDSVIW